MIHIEELKQLFEKYEKEISKKDAWIEEQLAGIELFINWIDKKDKCKHCGNRIKSIKPDRVFTCVCE
jgi:hypothetical protein